MTNAVAARLALAELVTEGRMSWGTALCNRPATITDAAAGVGWNASVGFELVKDWVGKTLSSPAAVVPAEGEGVVHREGARPVGICTVNGAVSRVSAVCTQVEECHFDGGPSEVVAATTLQALRLLAGTAATS